MVEISYHRASSVGALDPLEIASCGPLETGLQSSGGNLAVNPARILVAHRHADLGHVTRWLVIDPYPQTGTVGLGELVGLTAVPVKTYS